MDERHRTAGSGDVIVETAEGLLRGIETASLDIFKGVPCGGDIASVRFRPPLRPWSGVRDAVKFGPQCCQRNTDTAPWRDPTPENEDCLFPNIWSPKARATSARARRVAASKPGDLGDSNLAGASRWRAGRLLFHLPDEEQFGENNRD
jgi:hypothetical protein